MLRITGHSEIFSSSKFTFAHPTHRPSDIRPGIREHDLSTELQRKPGIEIATTREVMIGDSILRFERRSGGHVGVNRIDSTGRIVEKGKMFEFTPGFSFTGPIKLTHFGKAGLLVLSRKKAESIVVDGWHIHVAEISGGKVKLAIEAPNLLVPAVKEEVLDLNDAPDTISLVGINKDDQTTAPAEAYPVEQDAKPFPAFIQVLEVGENRVRLGLSFHPSVSISRREGEQVQGLVLSRIKDERVLFPSYLPSPADVEQFSTGDETVVSDKKE